MLDVDAICEPVDPLWNIRPEYERFCQKYKLQPRNEKEVRLIAQAVRQERTGDELKQLKRRLRDPEKYREKRRRHEMLREQRRRKQRYFSA